jgi:NADH-quinone oxidoreductase subunit M
MVGSPSTHPILTIITFLPLVGALSLLAVRKENTKGIRNWALAVSILTFGASVPLFFGFDLLSSRMQFEQSVPWVPSFGIQYHVGIDGISLFLVLLTTFLTPLAILSSWNSIEKRVKEYYLFMLLLETGMVGVFIALDLFLFYVFWEVMLVPMYFLIGVWGGERRIYAAIKFFVYTMVGSVLMLVAIISLYFLNETSSGTLTFDFSTILANVQSGSLILTSRQQYWLFLAFFVAFAIKVPLFPFHTWLPDAHVEAPTAGSVILAGVLLKMGTYGVIRFCLPLFPEATLELTPLISVLAVIGIIYGALVAMVQPDIKKLVAYSSVSHLGFVVLGIFALNEPGMEGAIYQMLNHGISTGALFLLVGMIYDRRHTRLISEFGGLAAPLPVFSTMFLIVTLSSIGLPFLNGFVGEFLILLGAFGAFRANLTLPVIATSGVILSAVYMLWMYQRVMFGEVINPKNNALKDLSFRERLILLPIVVLIVWMGVYSSPFLRRMDSSVSHILQSFRSSAVVMESKGSRDPAATPVQSFPMSTRNRVEAHLTSPLRPMSKSQ